MRQAIRGSILHFLDDPGAGDRAGSFEYFEDGLLLVEEGRVAGLGSAGEMLPGLAAGTPLDDCSGMLILPGFIDAHVHSVQTDVIGSHGRRLLEWLEQDTFPAERALAGAPPPRGATPVFLPPPLWNGTTTPLLVGSVSAGSVDAGVGDRKNIV